MKIDARWILWIAFMWLCGCKPLPPKVLDISSPQTLAEAFLETLISEDSEEFVKALVLDKDSMGILVASIEEGGEISINPKFIEAREEETLKLLESWQKVRNVAQQEGVLWKTVKYYGCRYKILQHTSQLPLSMSFEVYFEVGGYFYRIDISSICFEENYYIFDKIGWKGEVEKPEFVVKSGS